MYTVFHFFRLSASHDLRLGMDDMLLALYDHGFERSGKCVVNNNNNVYSSVYAIPVAYFFLHVPGIMYVWSTLSAEYGMDQPGVVASPARGHLKK